MPHILLLEPYYGGSHRSFLKGLQAHLPFTFTLLRLPARKWKMRMQLAAPWMARKVLRLLEKGEWFDAILCSTFVDAATLRALLAGKGIYIPVAIYFHENQFAYPNQLTDPSFYQFTALNFTSALAADSLAFNSDYNRDTFFSGVEKYLGRATDMDIGFAVSELRNKSIVLHPGVDFSGMEPGPRRNSENTIPVIVWNHRWEHDKDPEAFFRTMMELSGQGKRFKLIVLGQQFERCPDIFVRAEKALHEHLLHFGYAHDRDAYIRLLQQGDIVASTAVHEFFGMAVLEGVRCGCRPLVPDRLSYRELFPPEYRYAEGEFTSAVDALVARHTRFDRKESLQLTECFSWPVIAGKYAQWIYSWLEQ